MRETVAGRIEVPHVTSPLVESATGHFLSAGHMTIHPLLSSQAFDPETIDRMSGALKGVCETLSLTLTDGPETRLVAQKIIELAQRGVRDVATLQTMTLSAFKYD